MIVNARVWFPATASGWIAGSVLLHVLGMACGTSLPAGTAAQPSAGAVTADPGPSDSLVSATMLRVLAETADEFRSGTPVYLVAAFGFPHTVRGGFPSREAAERARAAAGPGHGVFGPYVTPEDEIPDSVPRVVSVRLELETPGGRRTVTVNPDTVNALFFTQSAYDKFVTGYYARVYGAEYAAELRDISLLSRPKGHCLSRMCLVLGSGEVEYLDPVPPMRR
jgi:hypothetical protein